MTSPALRLQAHVEQHLDWCYQHLHDEVEEDCPADWESFGPFCGCNTCVVREILAAALEDGENHKHEEGMVWRMSMEMQWVAKSEHAQIPTQSHPGDAGWDLYTSEDTVIPAYGFRDVPTGVAVALPEGTWGEILGRSSTFRTKGLHVIHGVIDNGWRGELFAGAANPGPTAVLVAKGERIAQLIPHPLIPMELRQVEELPEAQRGTQGFGSSGA